MAQRLFVCRRCGKRIESNADYVVVSEKYERHPEEREHVDCNEKHAQETARQ